MKYILSSLFFFIVLISCNDTPEYKFNNNGVALTSPKGWSIVDEEGFDTGYYLCIEKDGFNSSGVISFSWVNDSLNIEDYIENYKTEIKNNIVYKNSNLVFEPIIKNKFNNIESYSTKFKFSLLNLDHEGIIHSFIKEGKTYIIFKQEAIEDKNKNRLGFKEIEESFRIQ